MSEGRGCVDDGELVRLVDRRLSSDETRAIAEHAEHCDACQSLVGAVLAADTREERRAHETEVDTSLEDRDVNATRVESTHAKDEEGTPHSSRYTLGETLGQGAMGRVVLAHDTRLDRPVALKVLRDEGGASSVAMEARLGREARAMAKLLHPNVVAVFDAGRLPDGRLFVAMEYVEGETLRRHLERKRPDTRGVLGLFVEAARGLVAAHAMGLVHRDFKPDNVLVSKTYAVKVGDFGLVRHAFVPGEDAQNEAATDGPRSAPRSQGLTRHGSVLGTPAYMAPEQHDGKAVDARADQFAFMVSLYEALAGRRPFSGATLEAMREAMNEPVPPPLPSNPALSRVVLRGLAVAPEARYPSMGDVLAELEAHVAPRTVEPLRTRRRWVLGAVVLGVLALVGGSVATFIDDPTTKSRVIRDAAVVEEPAPLPTVLATVTAPDAMSRVREAFAKAEAPRGTDTAALTLLRASAEDLDTALRATNANGAADAKRRGEVECLTFLADDVERLFHAAEHVFSRSAAEGVVLAARELDHATVCRGASADPEDAGEGRTDPKSLIHVRMRRPMSVSPVVPGPFDGPTKSGLFALTHVLTILSRDSGAFPEDDDYRMFDDVIESMMGRLDDRSQLPKHEADNLARGILAPALAPALAPDASSRRDAGAPARDASLVRAFAFADALSMDAMRARLTLLRMASKTEDEQARELGDLLPLVRRVDDAPTSALYAVARIRLDATRGLAPPKGTTSPCAALPLEARRACFPLLDAVGDVSPDRESREVDLEITTAKALHGAEHPRAAFALVHGAEWMLTHEKPQLATELALEAAKLLETSLAADESVQMGLMHAGLAGGTDAGAPLSLWTKSVPVGDEAHAKYVYLARAYATLVLASPEGEARKLIQKRSALQNRDPANAAALPFELAIMERFGESSHTFDLEKAAARLGHPRFSARVLARLAVQERNEEKSRALYARALRLVELLPAEERSALRVGAARKVSDKTVARALLEKALPDARGPERATIAALLRTLPDTPSVHGARP